MPLGSRSPAFLRSRLRKPCGCPSEKRVLAKPASWQIEHLATLLLPSSALIVGGVSLVVGAGGGLYWVLAGIMLTFVSASINVWVLLVEIKR